MRMLLTELIDKYVEFRNAERPVNAPLSKRSRQHFVEGVAALSKFLCRPATTDDLTPDTVNKYLSYLFVNGRAEYTVKSRRTGLRALWNFAHRNGLAPAWGGVRDVRVNHLVIKGYDEEAITTLVEYVATLRGVVRNTGLPKRMWWETFLLVLWETGIRCGDMLHIRPGDFDRTGWLWIVEHKTSKRGWRRLRESVAVRLREFIDWDDARPFVWPGYHQRWLYRAFSDMARQAGVGGTFRWVRRGSASEVERLYPGAGWRFLHHSVPTLFDKHYRVDKIVEEQPLAPPELDIKAFRPIVTKER